MKGIYEQNPTEKYYDRELIFETADKYGIHEDTFIETLNKTDNPTSIEYYFGMIGNISTFFGIISMIFLALVIIVNKLKWNISITQSLKDELNELLSIKKLGKNKK